MKKAKKATKPKLKLVADTKPAVKQEEPKKSERRPIATPSRVAAFASRPSVTPYVIPEPFPGVLPKGAPTMAQDEFIGSAYGFAPTSYGRDLVSEGLAWPGYAYLAELSQRAEYRRISETLAREMTRKWIKIQASGDDDKSDKIKALETAFDKFRIRDAFRAMAEADGFFGRGQLYVDTGYTNDPNELMTRLVLSPTKIGKGDLKGFRVVSPMWTYPTGYNSIEPLSPHYYEPTSWFVMGKQIHTSRLLTFIGRELPEILRPAYNFSGLSMSQMAKPYIDNWLRTRQSVSDLLHSFSVSGIKTNLQAPLGGVGGDEVLSRAQMFNLTRDNRGLFMIDKETEDFFNVSTPLGTLDHLLAQAQEQMASVSGIPLVKLLGITPSGLNASSDGEVRCFYDFIGSYQQHLFARHLETVLKIIQLNEFGVIDEEIGFKFEPLWELNELEAANVRKTDVDSAVELINAGVLHPEEERKRLATDENSIYHGLDVDDVPDPPEMEGEGEGSPKLLPNAAKGGSGSGAEDGYSLNFDEWNEADHPRAENGEFTTGGGGGGKSESSSEQPSTKPRQPKLTSREKAYIESYTGDDFYETNRALRNGDGENRPEVKSIDAAIAKSVLSKGTMLYRGMTREDAKKLVGGSDVRKGMILSDKAFLSTGRNKDFVSSFRGLGGVVLEIETGEGQSGLDVAGLTRNPVEGEVLLPRDTRMRVKGITPPKKVGEPVIIKVVSVPSSEPDVSED